MQYTYVPLIFCSACSSICRVQQCSVDQSQQRSCNIQLQLQCDFAMLNRHTK